MCRRIGLLAAGLVVGFLGAVAPASAAQADQASTDSVVVAFPAPSVWPGTDLAIEVGYQDLRYV